MSKRRKSCRRSECQQVAIFRLPFHFSVRKAFSAAVESDWEDEAVGGLLTKRVKSSDEEKREEEDFIRWLKTQEHSQDGDEAYRDIVRRDFCLERRSSYAESTARLLEQA